MTVFLISLVAIGLTILLYYKNLGLAPLRIFSIIILCLLITGFALSLKLKKRYNPPAVVIDYSPSMSRYLPNVLKKTDSIDFAHSRFFFSESLLIEEPEDSTPFGKFTDITGAILKVKQVDPCAIILISDGNHNFGNPSFSAIDNLNIPIYSFGVGEEKQKDVAIFDISFPEYAFVDDSVKLEVTIQSRGFKGGKGKIQLKSTKEKIDQIKYFPLSEQQAKNNIDFYVHITQPGEEKFLIRLAPQSGEQTYKNNEFEFSLKILETKIRVLYYTEHLSFNTKFILRVLRQDVHIDFQATAKMNKSKYLNLMTNEKQISVPELEKYDVLILDNANLYKLPWHNVSKSLKQGLGILCTGTFNAYTDPWREIIPINTTNISVKGNHPIKIKEPFSCLVPGDDYPSLAYVNRVLGITDKAVIVAEANNIPIIAYQGYGKGKVFQINGVDLGTWQLLLMGLKQKDLLSCLMADIIRFISPTAKNKRLILRSLKRNYMIGEVIDLSLQSFDRNFTPLGNGDFYLEFNDEKIPFFEVAKGIYKTSLIAKNNGNFILKASGELNEEVLRSNELEIDILPQTIEIEQGLNKEFLQTLSVKTKGSYYSINELKNFEVTAPKERRILRKIGVNSPISYFVILCLLAIDWFLRRKQGVI